KTPGASMKHGEALARLCARGGSVSVLGYHVEGNRRPCRGIVESDRSVPHIGREQNQTARHRLDDTADGRLERDIERRLAELDPTLLPGLILRRIRHSDIVTGTDPAHGMKMIDVETLVAKPRRP